MEFLLYVILLGIAMTLYLLYCWLTTTFDYWKKRNVVGPKPIPIFGTFKDLAFNRIHAADYIKSIYDAYPDEPAVGLFYRSEPISLVRDLNIIKDVLVKSFTTFPNRGLNIHEDIEPLAQHLVFLEYKRWKPLRKKLTPVFTPGKLKAMFHLIDHCAEHFVNYVETLDSKGEPVECRELTVKYTTEVIGVCVFGLDTNAMSDEDSEFRKVGRKICQDTFLNKLILLMRFSPHWVAVLFEPFTRDEQTTASFVNIVTSAMDYRKKKKNNIRRHDFIDILMDIRDHPEQIGEEAISDMILTAQAFNFFLAGFEMSSIAISNAMYELALNLDIQEKLRNEVKITFDENRGKLSYDAVKNMQYLDKVLKETLRKYPPIRREVVNDHTFTESNIKITKGTKVFVPVYGIHHDPNIYPDPEKFDPERFEEEVVESRPPMTFLPFGDGPRICIGERFAHNQMKLGLATIIRQLARNIKSYPECF